MLRCRAVQGKLTAYVHGELPLKARRRVSAHLEGCHNCQMAYQRQRELIRELERDVPRVGQAHSVQLARVWSRVEGELRASAPRPTIQYRASYGVAVLLFMIAMVVPYILSRDERASEPVRTLPAQAVAFATDMPDERVLHRVPENALSRTAPAVVRVRSYDNYVTPQAALTPAPRP